MASVIVDIADELVTYINAGSYTTTGWTAARRWLAYFDRESLGDDPRVTVIASDDEPTVVTRKADGGSAKVNHRMTVEVYVQGPADYGTTSTVDPFVELTDEIYTRVTSMPPISAISVQPSSIGPQFDPYIEFEHLFRLRMFTSRTLVVFEAVN